MAELTTGQTLGGRFTIAEPLAGGWTGQVFRATDQQGGQQVVVKLVDPRVFPTSLQMQRTQRELKQLERLDAPGIAHVFAHGKEGEQLWIATEWVDGHSLQELVAASGPMAPARANAIVKAIGAALTAAARAGVIHRDVAPKNVLIGAGDVVKLINFGVPLPGDSVQGVPEFVSPEQVEGKPVDQRSNIYSLGVLYYFMLTGMPPYTGEPEAIHKAHLAGAAPPPSSKVAIPPALDKLVQKAMARASSKRFMTLGQLLGDIDRVGQSLGGAPQAADQAPESTQSMGRAGAAGGEGKGKKKKKKAFAQTMMGGYGALPADAGKQLADAAAAAGLGSAGQPQPAQQPQPQPVQPQPVQQAPVQQAPVQQAPVQQAPVQPQPAQQAPVQPAPAQQAPVQQPSGGGGIAAGLAGAAAGLAGAAAGAASSAAGTAAAAANVGAGVASAGTPAPQAPKSRAQTPQPQAAQPVRQQPVGNQPPHVTAPMNVRDQQAVSATAQSLNPSAPKISAGSGAATGGKRKKKKKAKRGKKGNFRETMWFKKGELDAEAAQDAAGKAQRGDEAALDKADSLPIEDRYKDDGTLTDADSKFSLRTGHTSMMEAIGDEPAPSTSAVSEADLIDEMKGGRGKVIFAIVGVIVLLIGGLIFFSTRGGDEKKDPKQKKSLLAADAGVVEAVDPQQKTASELIADLEALAAKACACKDAACAKIQEKKLTDFAGKLGPPKAKPAGSAPDAAPLTGPVKQADDAVRKAHKCITELTAKKAAPAATKKKAPTKKKKKKRRR